MFSFFSCLFIAKSFTFSLGTGQNAIKISNVVFQNIRTSLGSTAFEISSSTISLQIKSTSFYNCTAISEGYGGGYYYGPSYSSDCICASYCTGAAGHFINIIIIDGGTSQMNQTTIYACSTNSSEITETSGPLILRGGFHSINYVNSSYNCIPSGYFSCLGAYSYDGLTLQYGNFLKNHAGIHFYFYASSAVESCTANISNINFVDNTLALIPSNVPFYLFIAPLAMHNVRLRGNEDPKDELFYIYNAARLYLTDCVFDDYLPDTQKITKVNTVYNATDVQLLDLEFEQCKFNEINN
ncbi:hypothetical protein GPJ56_008703 [Histomonas meleagridis]|uniref:uncharacterized protein n=1 Tax=Histomonas meleagridis TaxID=135588 RepID=UPI00355A5479|nr:hypothetical protein GPJ56_008703 [Histomonas meleagridis]KAH0805718.1 hypothetical protein GO595_001357 [Histomonas meleagridis]